MAAAQASSESGARTRIHIHAERSVPTRAEEFLAQGKVAHVGFAVDGQPYVIPFSYHYDSSDPKRLLLHGSTASRALLHLADGAPVCVTVTMLDGLVYSRTALYHSMNYRSVVCFGRARIIETRAEKRALFEAMILRYFAERTAGRDYDAIPDEHLDSTTMVDVRIEEISAKLREGGPKGPRDADSGAPGTCGVVELHEE
jgi:nitroimidazol reductase NimA-like FMN-containing flavoprotein (pyridoxamine 5'-phosphate oxidase superfamily)